MLHAELVKQSLKSIHAQLLMCSSIPNIVCNFRVNMLRCSSPFTKDVFSFGKLCILSFSHQPLANGPSNAISLYLMVILSAADKRSSFLVSSVKYMARSPSRNVFND